MPTIRFSAFSFLKTELNNKGIDCSTSPLKIPANINLHQLIELVGLQKETVEAVFVNHRIVPKETLLVENDKVALVPPGGIPGHVAAYVGKNNN